MGFDAPVVCECVRDFHMDGKCGANWPELGVIVCDFVTERRTRIGQPRNILRQSSDNLSGRVAMSRGDSDGLLALTNPARPYRHAPARRTANDAAPHDRPRDGPHPRPLGQQRAAPIWTGWRRQWRKGPARAHLACGNQAHAYAAMGEDKAALAADRAPNIGIVTAYNDMLSAHQPFEAYPGQIRAAARRAGATAQVAGGVPAMCDGVTQGQPGMELSLFSRDVIALAAGVAMSHNCFDAALYLGVCDKIVPGLIMAAATFGHVPAVFVPAGPMTSGLPNDEKSKVRNAYAEGQVGRDALMAAEMASYHGPGTCTFYGTANTNQMLMEFMGLHLPGASFVNPGTPLREALTDAAVERPPSITALGQRFPPGGRDPGRAGLRERDRRADGHGRVDQPGAAPARDGAGGGRAAGPCRISPRSPTWCR